MPDDLPGTESPALVELMRMVREEGEDEQPLVREHAVWALGQGQPTRSR